MTYVKKPNFSSGELDPSLHDKTDNKTYFAGLKTARNVVVGKTGSILNSSGTFLFVQSKSSNENTRFYVPENQDFVLEFGTGYVRAHDLSDFANQNYLNINESSLVPTFNELATVYTLSDLPKLKFTTIKERNNLFYTRVACDGKPIYKFYYNGSTITASTIHALESIPVFSVASGILIQMLYSDTYANMIARTTHTVQYGMTLITKDLQESLVNNVGIYAPLGDVDPTHITTFIKE